MAYATEEWFPSRIASDTASRQESPDELRRRDGLRLVTRAAEDIEMPVFSDDVIRRRRDGAIGEFVVVWIGDDEPEAKRGTDPQEVAFQGVDFIHAVKEGQRRAAPNIRPTISEYSSRISVDTAQRNAPSNQASSSGACGCRRRNIPGTTLVSMTTVTGRDAGHDGHGWLARSWSR